MSNTASENRSGRRTLHSTLAMLLLALGTAGLALSGCDDPPGNPRDDAGPIDAPMNNDAVAADAAPSADAAVPDPGAVDILFVVDSSGSMLEEQQALGIGFQSFLPALSTAYGRLPDMHIGVVSADMGAGPWPGTGCSFGGDGGRLLSNPACNVSGNFISDVEVDGTREVNYTGTLEDTFSCSVQLGATGCGFEQTLESMRRALDGSNPENAGFLRENAMLVIVILSDEDDCSVHDTAMYDTTQNDINAPLGPLTSFRCFEFGIQCDPDTPRVPGARSNCESRDPSPYMYGSQEYIDFLQGLKPPGWVHVTTIQGPTTPVTVDTTPETGYPRLAPSCVSANGEAAPGVILSEFASGFIGRNQIGSICDDLGPAMQNLGTNIGNLLP